MKDIIDLPPLEYLRSFVIFVESAHIVEAAGKLKISQPLLSKHLKRFEDLLGVSLFQFQGRKKVLTHTGREVYEMLTRQLNTLADDLRLTLVKSQKARSLRIGGRRELLESLFLKLKYDGSLEFQTLDGENVVKKLRSRKLDIGISQAEIESDSLVRKKIWIDEFVLVWNHQIKIEDDLPLSKKIQSLLKFRCYCYPDNSILDTILQSTGHKNNLIQTFFSDWRILTEAVKTEKSWGIAPIGYVEKHHKLKYAKLPTHLNFEKQFYIYYQKELSKLNWFSELVGQIITLGR